MNSWQAVVAALGWGLSCGLLGAALAVLGGKLIAKGLQHLWGDEEDV